MESQPDTAQKVGGEMLSDAKGVGATAVNRLHSEADARKGEAVTQAQAVSSAVGKAAEGLDPEAPAWLKSALEQGAQKIQKLAESVEQKDSRQLVGEVGNFARNSPGTFLTACAAAGFAAARIFKAGGAQSGSDQFQPADFKDQTFEPSELRFPESARQQSGDFA